MFVRTALRRSLGQVRHVTPVRPRAAPELVSQVYRQVEHDFGLLAPPVALHSPAPECLAACWLMLREALVADGRADRATKEAVAAAVSRSNACPYCIEVHGASLRGLAKGTAANAIAAGRLDSIGDERLRQVTSWAHASTRNGTPHALPTAQLPELIGVAVTFHYLNRMVNIFLGDSPLPVHVPPAAQQRLRGLLGRIMLPAAQRTHDPGESLLLLPAAPLDDVPWASGNDTVAAAFARAYAAVDRAGQRSVPEAVRHLLNAELAAWDGRPPGLSRAWVQEAVAGLPGADRPAGRLALLTAKASYQVDDELVEELRAAGLADRALIEVASWSSLAAARQVGRWMWAAAR